MFGEDVKERRATNQYLFSDTLIRHSKTIIWLVHLSCLYTAFTISITNLDTCYASVNAEEIVTACVWAVSAKQLITMVLKENEQANGRFFQPSTVIIVNLMTKNHIFTFKKNSCVY